MGLLLHGLLVFVGALAGCDSSESRIAALDQAPRSVNNAPPPAAESLDSQVLVDLPSFERCDFLNREHCLFPWPNDWFTVEEEKTSNAYGTSTGRRVNLSILSMPANVAGKPLDPSELNRNDGFSPGQAILARIPGVDLARTGAVPITNLADGARDDQPIVVIDADTLERHLVWTELDANVSKFTACDAFSIVGTVLLLAGEAGVPEELGSSVAAIRDACAATPEIVLAPLADPGPALVVRPAVNFEEGHRYIVALRDLKDRGGAPLEAPVSFRIYRDNHVSDLPQVEGRRAHFEDLFRMLGGAGIARESLYLTWDFTVASRKNLSERMLSIRDQALAELGDRAPAIEITEVVDDTGDSDTAREIRGIVTVPSFLNLPDGRSGSRFWYPPGGGGLPGRNPFTPNQTFDFLCRIPRSAFGGAEDPGAATTGVPARLSLYGHGLLGSKTEGAGQIGAMTNEHNFVYCATDWIGMATHDFGVGELDTVYHDPPFGDLLNVGTILLDMSNFPSLADRVQQAMLNFIWLGRAMLHPGGLCAHAPFWVGDTCLLDRSELYYDGNSQGGIIGGSLVAVSPDIRRGVLGVPGMNYSTLLQRSVDFDTYAPIFYASYPASLDQQLVLSLVQMLWDRAETNGYAHHLRTDRPYVGTPPKRILLHPAFGDHQVSMWTAEAMARTIGASVHCPAVVSGTNPQRGPAVQPGTHPGVAEEARLFDAKPNPFGFTHPRRRHPDEEPYLGLPCLSGDYAHGGNALVVWDRGPMTGDTCEDNPGTGSPPVNNTPPRPSLCYGDDPHSDPRDDVNGRRQKSEFLRTDGRVINVCGNRPCATRGFDPTP